MILSIGMINQKMIKIKKISQNQKLIKIQKNHNQNPGKIHKKTMKTLYRLGIKLNLINKVR